MIFTIKPAQKNDFQSLKLPFKRESGFIGWVGATPIGYTNWYPITGLPNLVEIEIWIHSSVRKQGYGGQLLDFLVSELEKTPFTDMSAVGMTDKQSRQFMSNRGFTIGHEEIKFERALGGENGDSGAITVAKTSVAPELRRLYDITFSPHPWYQPFETDGDVTEHLEANGFIITSKDGGFAGIIPAETTAVIEPVWVVPEAQGKGVGKRFLTDLLAWLAESGYQHAHLTVWKRNRPAIHIYKTAGFKPISANQFWTRKIDP